MKAILEFNLPEDAEEFDTATNAYNYYHALGEVEQYLRKLDKYDDRDNIPIEEIREMFYNIVVGEFNISL